jgi:hypothetical protein
MASPVVAMAALIAVGAADRLGHDLVDDAEAGESWR